MSEPEPPDVVSHLEPMTRYARSLARGDAAEADDLVGEALLKALESGASFRPEGNLRGWLLSILHNTFISRRRRDAAEARRRSALAEMTTTHQQPPSQDGQLRLAEVGRALMALPEEQRAALHLVAVEGLSYAEAAVVLGVPVGTLMSRLARGRAALRAWEETRAGPAAAPRRGPPDLKLVGGSDAS